MVQYWSRLLPRHAPGDGALSRYLPKRFALAAQRHGLAAEHIDGNSPDRREILSRYSNNETRVLSCATLLLEGWDEPSIDCVVVMRPTQSRTVFVQAIGRGTRIHPGKDHLLILDPLWLSTEHSLVRPANLIATSAVEAQVITEALSEGPDLLRARQRAREVSLTELQARATQLAMQLEAGSRRERQVFDALELSVAFALPELANFEPVVPWHFESVSERQADGLRSFGIDPASVRNRGHGSLILKHLYARRVAGLARGNRLSGRRSRTFGVLALLGCRQCLGCGTPWNGEKPFCGGSSSRALHLVSCTGHSDADA